jgi:uncharacterized Ntn-hydrolase superfamily protein
MKHLEILVCLITLTFSNIYAQHYDRENPFAATYSIVARDTATGEMAVGVQSHWFSVGTAVPWGESGVGVIATQSFVNLSFGPEGLKLLGEGKNAEETLRILIEADEGRDYRQLAVLDIHGIVAAYTGKKCIESAGHYTDDNYSVQANMMLYDKVVPAMKNAWEINANLALAERVLEVLQAAQQAGGDIRGKQSAALIVVGPDRVAEAWQNKRVDLRVDDAIEPLTELERLLHIHRAYEHMNQGDKAIEDGNMQQALDEYGLAARLLPENPEMKFWEAVALANNNFLAEALPLFKEVFEKNENWRELTRRLPAVQLLNVSESELEIILSQ